MGVIITTSLQNPTPQQLWVGKILLDGARETLVILRVVILQTDLQIDRLEKVPLLFDRLRQERIVRFVKGDTIELFHRQYK